MELKVINNQYLEETIKFREHLEGGFISLAERLKKIRDQRIYAEEYTSFKDFLREIRISESAASKLIGVYEKFVLLGEIPIEEVAKAGWTNISLALPAIKDKETAVEMFNKFSLLDRTDALRTWQEIKTGVDMVSCSHTEVRILHVCCNCGIKIEQPK